MSERAKHLAPYILTLRDSKPKQRKIVTGLISKDQTRGLEDIAVNIVKNTVPLTDDEIKVFKRWKRPLKLLALKRYPSRRKKNILQQGRFSGVVLPVIASVLWVVIGSNG